MKRKFEDFQDDSQFRFWGIVISRFVWGYSRSEVAQKFSCSEPYVTKVMKKFEEDEGYKDHRKDNKAEHLLTTQPVEKIVVSLIKKKPNITSPQILEKIEDKGHEISERSVRNIRTELGFTKIRTSLLPNLSEDNIQSRLDYCTKHLNDKFSNVVFTDESNFQLAANRQVLWYRKDEDHKPHLTKPRNNRKIMIWGGISRKGQTPLHIFRLDEGDKVNKDSYLDCLEDNLIDCMDSRFGENKWRLMQDNARPHKAEDTMDFLQDYGIRTLDHPPYSADLNPIEKVWAWMKSEIGQTTYTDIKSLIRVVKKKWASMTIKFQNDLIDHHMKVVKDVYNAGGIYV